MAKFPTRGIRRKADGTITITEEELAHPIFRWMVRVELKLSNIRVSNCTFFFIKAYLWYDSFQSIKLLDVEVQSNDFLEK